MSHYDVEITEVNCNNDFDDYFVVYPNPQMETKEYQTIEFGITEYSVVRIEIVDAFGKIIASPFNGILEPGIHDYKWGPEQGASSSIYFCLVSINGVYSTHRMLYTPN